MPKLIECDSSAISGHHHDAETNTLTIRFRNGGTYQFPDVTVAQYNALVNAKSMGAHFARHFNKQHTGIKVG